MPSARPAVGSQPSRSTPSEHAWPRANFARAGLNDQITLHVADAGAVLGATPRDRWDLIFLDAERRHYVDYWPHLVRSLRALGLLAVEGTAFRTGEHRFFLDPRDPLGTGLVLR
jgi:predicted O-methyltransferase YrrM